MKLINFCNNCGRRIFDRSDPDWNGDEDILACDYEQRNELGVVERCGKMCQTCVKLLHGEDD